MAHWSKIQVVKRDIANALIKRGWTCYDNRPPMHGDYVNFRHWSGVATHPTAPGIVLCIYAHSNMVTQSYNPTHDIIILNLQDNHIEGESIPPYIPTPKGKAWHIETVDGEMLASGGIPKDCYSGEGIPDFIDRIEHIAFTGEDKAPPLTASTIQRRLAPILGTQLVKVQYGGHGVHVVFVDAEGHWNEALAHHAQAIQAKMTTLPEITFIQPDRFTEEMVMEFGPGLARKMNRRRCLYIPIQWRPISALEQGRQK